jgi:hypothetical protein
MMNEAWVYRNVFLNICYTLYMLDGRDRELGAFVQGTITNYYRLSTWKSLGFKVTVSRLYISLSVLYDPYVPCVYPSYHSSTQRYAH